MIFELGYFVGKLGRGRACLLRRGEIEIPSDLGGERASYRFFEYFTAQIRNPNTRRQISFARDAR